MNKERLHYFLRDLSSIRNLFFLRKNIKKRNNFPIFNTIYYKQALNENFITAKFI